MKNETQLSKGLRSHRVYIYVVIQPGSFSMPKAITIGPKGHLMSTPYTTTTGYDGRLARLTKDGAELVADMIRESGTALETEVILASNLETPRGQRHIYLDAK